MRDDWESGEEMGTRDKGRKDYPTLPLSPPATAAAADCSLSLLSLRLPLLLLLVTFRMGLSALKEAIRRALSGRLLRVN